MTRPYEMSLAELHDPSFTPNAFANLPLQEWPAQWRPTDRFPTPQSSEGDASNELVRLLSFRSAPAHYRLGEPDMPVAPYREYFVDTVREHQAVIASSETGSGKSSNLGLYLLEAGFPAVYVTQPRIVAARELMGRARYNLGQDYEHLAGYLTGNAEDSDCPESARLIYVTEELLFKMANRGQLSPDAVIINDEAHERTAPTVIFLGLMKSLLRENPNMRLVVSSATIDTGMFARKLGAEPDRPAPVLILPGRTHPTIEQETDEKVAPTMRRLIKEGHNVLGFLPGIAGVRTTAAKVQSRNSSERVHVLHGDQSPLEQKEALSPNDHNHIVSTKVGETSLTPQGKTAVVDSGISNIGRYVRGVRGLEAVFSSRAAMVQRRGRVGRTSPGLYVVAVPDEAPPSPAMEARPAYDPPAIENTSVASYLTELMREGRRLEDLDLLEGPTAENLAHDYKVLRRLGAIALKDDETYILTDIGRAMTDLPLDAQLARMLVEARQFDDDVEIDQTVLRLQVAAAVAIQQVNGILDAKQGSMQRYVRRKGHQEMLSNEQGSDVLFALDVFTTMRAQHQALLASGAEGAELKFEKLLADNDILVNRYYKAVRTFEELCRREGLPAQDLTKPKALHRERIIACQIAGADELFVQRSKQMHRDIRGETRTLGKRSTIAPRMAELVIGTAFDLRGFNKRGVYRRRFISGGSTVSTEELLTYAPHRITQQSLGFGVSRRGTLVDRQALYFDGELLFAEREQALPPTKETRIKLITAMMTGMAPSSRDPERMVPFRPGTANAEAAVMVWKKAQELQQKADVDLKVTERMASLIRKVVNEVLRDVPLDVTDPAALDSFIPKVYRTALVRPTRKNQVPAILERAPDAVKVQAEDESSQYLPVTYKSRIAYVTIPRDLRFSVRREDFVDLETHHDVKVRAASGKYLQIDALFRGLDEQRETDAAKRARKQERDERRVAAAAEARSNGEPTRRERRQDDEQDIENLVKNQIKLALQKRANKGDPNKARVRRLKQLRVAEQT